MQAHMLVSLVAVLGSDSPFPQARLSSKWIGQKRALLFGVRLWTPGLSSPSTEEEVERTSMMRWAFSCCPAPEQPLHAALVLLTEVAVFNIGGIQRERALQLGKRVHADGNAGLVWCLGCDTASLLERGPIVRLCSQMT